VLRQLDPAELVVKLAAPAALISGVRGVHMAALVGDRRFGRTRASGLLAGLVACALVTASCTSASYTEAAMKASDEGDQKAAVSLARKEVARFATPDECSRTTNRNCGTLALAYGSLAGYQILAGNRAAAESTFDRAKEALDWMDRGDRPSATAMVYRDVSEAFWKMGDRKRAIAVFNEGRAAGADDWLYMCSAAKAIGHGPTGSHVGS
jgi:hypothetical protein